MKKGWKTKCFAEVLEIRNGKNQRDVLSDSGTYPIYGSAGNVMGMATDYICEAGTTIIGRKGNINSPVFTDTPFWNVDTAFGLSALNELDAKFLFYFCQTYDFGALNRGTTIPSLVKSELLEIEMPVPPLAEQQRIVGVLDEAFAGLATAQAHAEKNLQNACALFESHLQSVFTQRGKGWVETTLDDEVEFAAGYAFKSSGYVKGGNGTRLLRGDNIMQGVFRWDEAAYWPSEDTLTYDRFRLKENDIVLAMDRPWVAAGLKIACVTKTDLPCLQVQRTARLRVSKHLAWRYLFHLLRSQEFVSYLLDGQTGLGVPHISGKQILSFRFFRPSLDEQQQIVAQLDALAAETQRLASLYTQKQAALAALKKSLLHQAFSGEL